MIRRGAAIVILATAMPASATLGAEPADATPSAPSDSGAVTDQESELARLSAFAASVETELAAMRENENPDEVLLAEAEALAAVANEMLALGDLETALSLLEEAIAILENSSPGG